MKKKDTYTINTVCDNCGKRQGVSIPKGTVTLGYNVICSNCGVSGVLQSLVKEKN